MGDGLSAIGYQLLAYSVLAVWPSGRLAVWPSGRLLDYGPVLTTPLATSAQRAAATTPMKRRMSSSVSQTSWPRRFSKGGAATAAAGAGSSDSTSPSNPNSGP